MTSGVYYNDSEPFVCDWLENLIRAGLLPAGVVDRRPIQEVEPADVRDFRQCHFFAGIGGWAYALQLAGWGDRPVWTGSCPCQPFSTAGKGQAEDDPRHLWPSWFRLIRECRPERVFGEQVANAAGHGWLDVVSTDLEAEAYRIGAVVLGAHSVGAPHRRQRIWFVADPQRDISGRQVNGSKSLGQKSLRSPGGASGCRAVSRLADTSGIRTGRDASESSRRPTPITQTHSSPCELADAEGSHREISVRWWRPQQEGAQSRGCGGVGGLEHTTGERSGGGPSNGHRLSPEVPWARFEVAPCRDGKGRPIPIEPALFPLASGVPNRVGILRGSGNAINPWAAAAFIEAYCEVRYEP